MKSYSTSISVREKTLENIKEERDRIEEELDEGKISLDTFINSFILFSRENDLTLEEYIQRVK